MVALLRALLREGRRELVGEGDGTLVAWRSEDRVAIRARLAQDGVVIRDLPRGGLLRASLGAWNDEDDLRRLVAGLG